MNIPSIFKNKANRITQQDSTDINVQQQTMMPTIIDEKEPQFLPVKEIGINLNQIVIYVI